MPQQQDPRTNQPKDPKEQSFKPPKTPPREPQRGDQPKKNEREQEIEKRASKMDEEGGFEAQEDERDSDW